MATELNKASFSVELLVTSHWAGNRGSQIVHGKCAENKHFSILVRPHVLARPAEEGEWWRFTGEWDTNPKYTNQIIAVHGEPLTVTGDRLAAYITTHPRLRCGEGSTRIGRNSWLNAINVAGGADTLAHMLDTEDREAITALGVGRLTHNAETVLAAWKALRGEMEGVRLLARYQVGKRLSAKLIKYYGETVSTLLSTDCYRLLAYDRNTEALFNSCQHIADAMGYPEDDTRRLVGAVDFVLNYRLDQHGHTAIRRDTLATALARIFNDDSRANRAIELALNSKAIEQAPDGRLQSRPVAYVEATLEHRFVDMLTTHTAQDEELLATLPYKALQVCIGAEHPLTAEQKAAIELPFRSRLSILTGGVGTGKTTVISSVIRLAHSLDINVFQMALSGQAADVMRRYNITHEIECLARTIHWYVLPQEASQETDPPFEFPDNCLIIIDECSMVDLSLMNRLMRVLPETARVLMVGDPNQIPPVGAGLVFHLLCQSEHIPIAKLTQPHRSAVETGIPAAAESISLGIPPVLPTFQFTQPPPKHGVYFLPAHIDKSDPYSLARVIYRVAEQLGLSATQVITTHRKKTNKWGPIVQSVHHINTYFQDQLTQNKAPTIASWGLNVGDPILVRKNVVDVGGKGFDLFNGNLGTLIRADKPYTFAFGDHKRELDDDDIAKLGIQLGYALTVHSFQGSAAECVVIAVTQSNLLERSLLYTALTRAKRTCVFVGDLSAFEKAIVAPPKWERISTGFGIDRYFTPTEIEIADPAECS